MTTIYEQSAPPHRTPPRRPQPSDGLLAAMRVYWVLIAVCVIVLGAAGAAAGLTAQQTYTAQAQLNVGGGDLTSQSIPGYAVGVQSLASAYSRAISADAIVARTATVVHRSTGDVRGALSASPIPESPLILVEATGPTENAAVALANAGSTQLINYVTARAPQTADADALLRRFRTASAQLAAAQRRLGTVKSDIGGAKDLSSEQASRLQDAQAAVDVAQLQTKTLADQYSSESSTGDQKSVVRVLASASVADSDRHSRAEKLALAGVVAGFVLGCALAMALWARRRPRRIA
jgi:uncharacterized protein involved in exopolysaccharide biosynthesis